MGNEKNIISTKISLSVGKQAKDEFYNLKDEYLSKDPKLHNKDFIEYILTLIGNDKMIHNYSKDIELISKIQGLPVARVCEEAIASYIKKIKNADKKGLTNNIKIVESDNLMNEVLKAIMAYNDNNEHLYRIFINQTSVAKFAADAEKMKSANLNPHKFAKNVIVRGLKNNNDIINEHHKKHELDVSHNIKAYAAKRFPEKNEVNNVSS